MPATRTGGVDKHFLVKPLASQEVFEGASCEW